MLTIPRGRETVNRLQTLLNATFCARDELYAASDALDQTVQGTICRWLGDRLGGNSATLQQIIAASGAKPVDPRSSQAAKEKLASISAADGSDGALKAAELTEHELTERYDQAIRQLEDQEILALLAWQRREAEMADRVLRSLKPPA